MHTLDGKSEGCTNGLQCFAFSIVFTNEVVPLLFGDVFFSDGYLRERDAPMEPVKQPIGCSIQGG